MVVTRPPLKEATLESRLLLVASDGSTRLLSEGFYAASDLDVSFDARRILFAGKKKAPDFWAIYELTLDDFRIRQITHETKHCRSPRYEGPLFTLDAPSPWHELAYVGTEPAPRHPF